MPLIDVDWDIFVFRSHYFGELMTKPKGKTNLDKYNDAVIAHDTFADKLMSSGKNPTTAQLLKLNELDKKMEFLKQFKDVPKFSRTAIRRLNQIYTEETTGRKKDIESMYIEKGLKTEEDSITLYSLKYGKMYRKNKERLSNGWITGEIDFDDEKEDMVIDAKSTFDIFTFDDKVGIGLSLIYEWQGHCYMWLKNRKRFRLAYCLNNTPEEMIKRMEKSLQYNFYGNQEDFEEACALLRDKHTYNDLPMERKIQTYDLERNEEKIEEAKAMIPHFRNYLKNFGKQKLEDDDTED